MSNLMRNRESAPSDRMTRISIYRVAAFAPLMFILLNQAGYPIIEVACSVTLIPNLLAIATTDIGASL